MLLPISTFILKHSVRNFIYLFTPTVNNKENITYPKQSMIHYLNNSTDVMFPDKNLFFFNNTIKNKKAYIINEHDLYIKEGNPVLIDKYINTKIRNWTRDNIKQFRVIELENTTKLEDTNVSIYNYNVIKNIYRYPTNLLSSFYKYSNIKYTYINGIKNTIKSIPEATNFLMINLPNLIPSYQILYKLMEYNNIKLMRIVKEEGLLDIIHLLLWLNPNTREKSIFKDLTDEDSLKIILQIEYKEKIIFVPLNVIISVSTSSSLDSKVKMNVTTLQKRVTISFLLMQRKIEKILEGIIPEEEMINIASKKYIENNESDVDVSFNDDDVEESIDIDKNNTYVPNNKNIVSNFSKPKKKIDIDSLISKLSKIESNFTEIKISDIDNLDLENEEIDDLFLQDESISDIKEEEEEVIEKTEIDFSYNEDYLNSILNETTIIEKHNDHISKLINSKAISSSEIKSMKKLLEERKQLKSPYEQTRLLDEYKKIEYDDINIEKNDITLNIDNNLVKDNKKYDIIKVMDKKYINKVINKDIVNCVSYLENNNLIIKDYEIENQKSKLGDYEIHRIVLKPLGGKESILYFKLPKINSEGEFLASGVKVKLRKQRTDLPIRKISHNKVALTSNYCKLFLSTTERKTYDYYEFINEYIKESYFNDNIIIRKITLSNSFNNKHKLPNIYHSLSRSFSTIETLDYTFMVNYNQIGNYITYELKEKIEKRNLVYIGFNKENKPLVADFNDIIYIYVSDDNLTRLGTIEEILEIPSEKVPTLFSNIKILGKDIPLGIVLSYYLGLSNVIKLTKANPIIIERNKQYKLTSNQYQLKFNDYKLIFDRSNKEATLLLSGFLYFKDFIKQYNISDFDINNIYLLLLEERDFNIIYMKELDLLRNLFLDPITQDVLKSVDEPYEYIKLLLRANQLLTTFDYPDVNDINYSRIRGYDRIPGLMYRTLTESIRNYKFNSGKSGKIEMSPYAVWNAILLDNSKKLTEDNNPITDIKEMEAVTLVGTDGINKDAVSSRIREYSKSEMGIISEATVDSSDVAINTFLSPYARFKNIRGIIDKEINYKDDYSKLLSTSALLAPAVNHDDQLTFEVK